MTELTQFGCAYWPYFCNRQHFLVEQSSHKKTILAIQEMSEIKDYSEKADALARKHGYFCACYIGREGTREVYSPCYYHNEVLTEGIPKVITISDDGATTWHQDYDSFPILRELDEYRCKRGQAIYKKIARRPKTDDERRLIEVVSQAPDKIRYYSFLELAERLQMAWQMNVDVLELVYCQRILGPTPNGGAYSETMYYDHQRMLCPPCQAKYINIVEYSAKGDRVFETYGVVS